MGKKKQIESATLKIDGTVIEGDAKTVAREITKAVVDGRITEEQGVKLTAGTLHALLHPSRRRGSR